MKTDTVWKANPGLKHQKGQKIPYEKRIIARAMLERGLSTRKVARAVGISSNSASAIGRASDLSPEFVEQAKNSLPGMYYNLAQKAAKKIDDNKLDSMNAYQLTLISKINADAGRMCEGLPTQTVHVKTIAIKLSGDMESLRRRKEHLLQSLGGASVDVQALPSREEKTS